MVPSLWGERHGRDRWPTPDRQGEQVAAGLAAAGFASVRTQTRHARRRDLIIITGSAGAGGPGEVLAPK